MSHKSHQDRGAVANTIIVAITIVVLLFGILVMAAAVVFYFRTTAMQEHTAIAQQEALIAEADARHQLELSLRENRVELDQRSGADAVSAKQVPDGIERIQLDIDEAGIIQIDGQTITLGELRQRFTAPLTKAFTLRVDAKCEFSLLAPVIQCLKDMEAADIELTSQE